MIRAASVLAFSLGVLLVAAPGVAADPDPQAIRAAATFYASFDEAVRGDVGGGQLTPDTRFNHPTEKNQFVVEKGIDRMVFQIAKDKGVSGGALEAVDVLP